jgi:hypothetical protein
MRTTTLFALTALLAFGTQTPLCAQKSKSSTSKKAESTKSAVVKDTLVETPSKGSIDRKFQPVLEPVERILVLPSLETHSDAKQPMVFSFTESPASLKGEYTPLPAAGIIQDFPAAQQLGFLRLGVGNHRSFAGDVQLNLLRKSTQTLDVEFSHRSVFGDVVFTNAEVDNAYYSDNDFQINYKSFQGKTILEASVGEQFRFWNYYGRRAAFGMDTLSMPQSQWSTDGHFSVGLSSNDLTNPLSWKAKITGRLFRLGNGLSSSALFPSEPMGGAEREFKLEASGQYEQSKRLNYGVDLCLRNFNYRLPVSYSVEGTTPTVPASLEAEFENRGYFEFMPNATLYYQNWRFKGGLKLSIPTLITESVRPNIVASAITPLSKKAVLSLSLDGGVTPNSYREGIGMNPFLDPAIRLRSSWKVFDLQGKIDYRPQASLCLSPEVGLSSTVDAPYFTNALPGTAGVNNTLGRMFTVRYMNTTQWYFQATGRYSVNQLFAFLGSVKFNTYQNHSDQSDIDKALQHNFRRAWYRPGVEAHLRCDVNPVEPLTLYADYKLEALRYACVRTDRAGSSETDFCKNIGDINNLSVGANYNVSKGVGIFLNVNNVLDQRYEGYYGYPVHGFTAVIGGSVAF